MRSELVYDEVATLYAAATTSMGTWMWRNHVQWVADKAKMLAEKYEADTEKVYCAALLHDLADCAYERGHADFENWSKKTGERILTEAGFNEAETEEILEAVRTHACRVGNLAATIEGKVLATADAMWHLQTGFFPAICYMNKPDNTKSYEQWQAWFKGKVERDFGVKIFFEDEQAEVKADYEALVRVFGKETLRGIV